MMTEYKGRLQYWQAKAELTRRQALMGRDVAQNLARMTYALEQARAIENEHITLFPGDDAA